MSVILLSLLSTGAGLCLPAFITRRADMLKHRFQLRSISILCLFFSFCCLLSHYHSALAALVTWAEMAGLCVVAIAALRGSHKHIKT
ncbi:hypothetical protein [Acetobacter thailandicus]|uniref:hypothetical protein n=1 Tax=Acetobacter thailandicus TaxID=1502842 RepID=UPI001BAAE3CD|nr:hypothetical protein [Acetobacter thailandicus]MBS1004074.1 hypothetical protein [Acetobacter thailandicus]